MAIQKANITIPECPVCGLSHTYRLKIERTLVMQISHAHESPQNVEVMRLFVCPTKNQDFQATFIVRETAASRIESIDITD